MTVPTLSYVLVVFAGVLLMVPANAATHFSVDLQAAKENPRDTFTQWLQHVERSYHGSDFEDKLQIWHDNLQHFVSQGLASAGLNGLADMSDDEFRQAYLGQRNHVKNLLGSAEDATKAVKPYRYRFVQPLAEVDWRDEGIVGPVKNQHVNGSKCGCCWAFATIAVVECINALATGELVSLSEQQLLDCDRSGPWFDEGCNGGDFDGGITYIINNGIALEEDYPYKAEDGKCDKKKEKHSVVSVDAVEVVPPNNETALMQGVSMHPIGVAVCVGPYIKEWRAYTGGIMKLPSNCDDPLDHAMVVVGYGTDKNTNEDFWLLKNGWGDQWGEAGFLRVARGVYNGTGAIGMLSQPGYPIKISPNPKASDTEADSWADVFGRRANLLS